MDESLQPLQARLRANHGDIPAAMEEMRRAFSVVSSSRTVLEAIEIDGIRIRKGDILTLNTERANHDPLAVKEPGNVDIDRSPNRHLAFGYGLHHCLGAPLARRELRIAMHSWFDLVPSFHQRGDPSAGLPCWVGNMLSVEALNLAG